MSGTVVIVGAGDATGKANDNFGFAMAVTDAHVVVVGAIRAQGATSDTAGAAYVYTCGGVGSGQCDDCAAFASCGACAAAAPTCGWCNASSVCVSGTANGPLSSTCAAGAWVGPGSSCTAREQE